MEITVIFLNSRQLENVLEETQNTGRRKTACTTAAGAGCTVESTSRCLQSTLAPDKNRCSGLILFPEIHVYTSSKPLELKEFVGPFKRN